MPRKYTMWERQRMDALKEAAFLMYKKGLSTREISGEIGKSHQWVAVVIREMEKKENEKKLK